MGLWCGLNPPPPHHGEPDWGASLALTSVSPRILIPSGVPERSNSSFLTCYLESKESWLRTLRKQTHRGRHRGPQGAGRGCRCPVCVEQSDGSYLCPTSGPHAHRLGWGTLCPAERNQTHSFSACVTFLSLPRMGKHPSVLISTLLLREVEGN